MLFPASNRSALDDATLSAILRSVAAQFEDATTEDSKMSVKYVREVLKFTQNFLGKLIGSPIGAALVNKSGQGLATAVTKLSQSKMGIASPPVKAVSKQIVAQISSTSSTVGKKSKKAKEKSAGSTKRVQGKKKAGKSK